MSGIIIPEYPEKIEVNPELRPMLSPLFKALLPQVSEHTFANIYLFRKEHNYTVTSLKGLVAILGRDGADDFFILPFGLPDKKTFEGLLKEYRFMKCVHEELAMRLSGEGYRVEEDRDNFDYLYKRQELSTLAGRRFHRKKNLVNYFTGTYRYEGRPLVESLVPDAMGILDEWRRSVTDEGDYGAAKEALEKMEELSLCGAIYFVEDRPSAWALGEELNPSTFVVHFEKGIGDYKGLLQFVNMSFASILPVKYDFINREQDLGVEGLRRSKLSYSPSGFVKKYKVFLP